MTVELADGTRLRSRYLVGCDGGRSTVRKLLGVGFPGEPATVETLLGEMEVTAPPERSPPWWPRSARPSSGSAQARSATGCYRVVVPAAGVAEDRAVPPTLEEFKTAAAGHRRHRLRRALPALAVPLRRRHPAGRALPGRAGAAGRRRGAHPPADRRAGAQPGHPGRVQPRLETGRRDPRLGAGGAAGQLPGRTASGRRGRAGQHPRPDGAAVHRAGPAGRAQAADRADGLRRGEPVPDREDHRDRHPLRLRRRPRPARPAAARHRR